MVIRLRMCGCIHTHRKHKRCVWDSILLCRNNCRILTKCGGECESDKMWNLFADKTPAVNTTSAPQVRKGRSFITLIIILNLIVLLHSCTVLVCVCTGDSWSRCYQCWVLCSGLSKPAWRESEEHGGASGVLPYRFSFKDNISTRQWDETYNSKQNKNDNAAAWGERNR